jgi:hypothetical protein
MRRTGLPVLLVWLPALLLAGTGVRPQAERPHVLPVLYLPAGEPFSPDRLELQVQAVSDAQDWYARRLGGITFYAEPLIVQRSGHTFDELAGNDFQNWWPLPAAEFAGWGIPWNDSSRVKLLILAQGAGAWAGADSENGGILAETEAGRSPAGHLGGLAVIGDSSIGGILAGVCPREGAASWRRPDTGTAWWCNWNTYRGTVAHELGHTFGLPHPDAFRSGFRCDSIVMTNMQCHWGWPADSLLPFETTHLRSLPVFGPDVRPLRRNATAIAVSNARLFDFARDRELLWLGGRGGGTGYRWGVTIGPGGVARFDPPPGAAALVLEMGWWSGERSADQVNIRFSIGDNVTEFTILPDALPAITRLPAGAPIMVGPVNGSQGTFGIGHPRWEMRIR